VNIILLPNVTLFAIVVALGEVGLLLDDGVVKVAEIFYIFYYIDVTRKIDSLESLRLSDPLL
jgi:hypothetical protein